MLIVWNGSKMNYLFFDIECCNGQNMCSLGYVLVDENFKILEKKDILINPEKPFNLKTNSGEPRIELAYDKSEFLKHPNFTQQYYLIKNTLMKNGRVLFAHDARSDISFLEKACKNYKQEMFDICVYDAQKIYSNNKVGLEKIINNLGVDCSHLTEHKSCDDAEMTMLYIKKLCEQRKCNISELINDNKNAKTIPRNLQDNNVIYYTSKDCGNSKTEMQIKFEEAFKRKNIDREEYLKSM